MHFVSAISSHIATIFLLYIHCAVPMKTLPLERVRFGAFELDLSTGELRSIEASDPEDPGPNNKVLLREPLDRFHCESPLHRKVLKSCSGGMPVFAAAVPANKSSGSTSYSRNL